MLSSIGKIMQGKFLMSTSDMPTNDNEDINNCDGYDNNDGDGVGCTNNSGSTREWFVDRLKSKSL